MYRKQVRRRRAVLVGLIVVSLILISSSFSESETGPLHTVQSGLASVASPLEEGADRALKPVRDLIDWFDETFDARGQNDELRTQVAQLRAQLAAAEQAQSENAQFRKMVGLDKRAPADLSAYERVTARVIGRPATVWYSTVTVDQGSGAGVEVDDAVITGDGLVGRVSDVTGNTAQVELITDHESAVSAKVLPDGPQGIVEPAVGDPDDLLLDFINSQNPVEQGQILITAGWSNSKVSSAYPYGIPLGSVSDPGTEAGGSALNQQVHVRPFADLRNLEYVQVLTGGPARPGVD
jgi:rod shape-determining protein MreC